MIKRIFFLIPVLLLAGTGVYAETTEDIAKALWNETTDPLFPVKLGLYYLEQRQYEMALGVFEAAVKHQPNSPSVYLSYYGIGIANMSLGRTDEAIQAFEKAIQLAPNDDASVPIRHDLALAYLQKKEHQKAIQELQRVIKLKPDFAIAYFILGDTYHLTMKYIESILAFRKFLSFQNQDKKHIVKAHMGLCASYYSLGMREKALAECRILQQLDPDAAREVQFLFEEKGK